eukprot:gene20314-22313_t
MEYLPSLHKDVWDPGGGGDEIEKNCSVSIDVAELCNNADLKDKLSDLSSQIQDNPELYLSILSLSFHETLLDSSQEMQSFSTSSEIPFITVRLYNYEPVTYLRNLKANYYGKFVSVRGTVVKVSNVKPLVTNMEFNCSLCSISQVLKLSDGKYNIPTKCISEECRSRSFIPNRSSKATTTIDSQIIKIQEIMLDDKRETGRIPRTIECELFSDLVDSCVPGDMVTVNGIVRLVNNEDYSSKSNKEKCMFLLYIHANSLTNFRESKNKEDSENQNNEFTLKELYAIQEIHSEKNLFKLIVGSLCPSIYGHELVKAGLVLGLFGGAQKSTDDKSQVTTRSDPHVLVVGDPGLGKSQMLQAVANTAPRGVFVCGNTTTTSGLTVTLSKETGTGDYALEAGALVLADQGCCCIDEFDKMGNQHQALLEAMEQQSISIAKAGIVCSLPARTSIIAAANPVGGHYDKAKTISENLKLSSALLSRFDLVFILLDKPDELLDCIISEHVMAMHSGNQRAKSAVQSGHQEVSEVSTAEEEIWNADKPLSERLKASELICSLLVLQNEKLDILPIPLLRKYIAYARKYVHPKISEEAASILQEFYLSLRRHYRGPESSPVTTRQLESLIRLTEARAKLELREKATRQDAEDIIEIMKFSLVDIFIDDMGNLNLERSLQGSGMSKRKQLKKFISEMTRIADRDCNSLFSFEQMKQLANYSIQFKFQFCEFVFLFGHMDLLTTFGFRGKNVVGSTNIVKFFFLLKVPQISDFSFLSTLATCQDAALIRFLLIALLDAYTNLSCLTLSLPDNEVDQPIEQEINEKADILHDLEMLKCCRSGFFSGFKRTSNVYRTKEIAEEKAVDIGECLEVAETVKYDIEPKVLDVIDSQAEQSHTQEATELQPLKLDLTESGFQNVVEEDVNTSIGGSIHVAVQGDRTKKTAIITLHDLGLDYISCFQSFFCFHQVQPLLKHFCVYHLNFPGQHEGAEVYPENHVYPSMDDVATMVKDVVDFYGIKDCICFGVGAGANVFLRFGLKHPDAIEGLVLVNGTCSSASWSEWGYQKMSSHYLKKKGMTKFTEDYLLWHYIGNVEEYKNLDLLYTIRDHLHNLKNTRNLAFLIDSYIKRKSINLHRPQLFDKTDCTLHPNTLLLCGNLSAYVDDTVNLNSKLDPKLSTWINISDATGMLLDEKPTAVVNAFMLFLQGLGHVPNLHPPTIHSECDEKMDVSHVIS